MIPKKRGMWEFSANRSKRLGFMGKARDIKNIK